MDKDKPLLEKLGYKKGETVATIGESVEFADLLKQGGVHNLRSTPSDWCHIFVMSKDELSDILKNLNLGTIKKGLWVSWPKRTGGYIETDLGEQTLRDLILPLNWVDTKVCSIDETWSGLNFLRRKKPNKNPAH